MATRTQDKPQTAADIQKLIKAKTNYKLTLVELAEALGLSKLKGADAVDCTINEALVALANANPTFKGIAKDALAEAQADSRHQGAQASRKVRKSPRAPRDGLRIIAGDFKILHEVQGWVDQNIQDVPENFNPKPDKSTEPGKVVYQMPSGQKVTVTAVEFGQMKNGVIPWKTPQPSRGAIEKRADMLASLSFIGKNCTVCDKPIEDKHRPEIPLVYQLLKGWLVLPFIQHDLKKGQMEARFRHNHLACSLIEDRLADLFAADPDTDLAEVFDQLVADVLREAQAKNPKFTEAEVLDHLDDVMAYLEKGGS